MAKKRDPALLFMVHDIVREILLVSKDSPALEKKITGYLREITGSKTVILIEFLGGKNQFHLNYVNPERFKQQFSTTLLGMLIESWYALDNKITLINKTETEGAIYDFLKENDFGVNLVCPLVVGDRKVGILLVFGMFDTRMIRQRQIHQILDILLGTVALILENSILIRNQEKTIRIRTSELNNTLEELTRQQLFLEAILNNIEDGIIACGSQGNISLYNQATKVFYDVDRKDLSPEEWSDHYALYKGDAQTPMQPSDTPLSRAFTGERLKNVEMVIAPKDKNKRYCLASGQAMFDPKGNKLGAVVSLHDITESKQNEEALKKAKESAEIANQAKSVFLAHMSHELRTPLNAILGFSEMIERDHDTPDSIREKVTIINHSGEHLLAMINDVLDLSKIEAGRVELEPENFNLPLMLQDIGRMFEMRANNEDLRFNLEISPELTKFIKADAGKLRQILINLLGNAVKFTEEGGFTLRARTISTTGSPTTITLQLEVEDSGIGIAAEEQQTIFEPFVQTGRSSNRPKGSGLGLAITKSFVELLGGEINVKSEIEKGSLFCVNLPVDLAEATETTGTQVARPTLVKLESNQSQRRILVVEDNPENRLLLVSLLTQAGFETRETKNGKEAIDQFLQWHPHFIWMDMRMPVMNGYEATSRIRDLPGGDKVKIVALTASAFKEQRQKILDAGCNDVVRKPYHNHEIFDAMAEQLGIRYRYEDASGEKSTNPSVTLTGEILRTLSNKLLRKLNKASHDLDIPAATEVIKEIRAYDAGIADGLQALIDVYQFDLILKLLKDTNEQ
ncbi:MAG: ATP-binding protein [Candidatus Thiodiazotropha sp.]